MQTKPNFASYRKMLDLEEATKKDTKKLEDKKLIGKALKEAGVAVDLSGEGQTVVSAASGGDGGTMKVLVAFISSLGKTMMEHWKQEGEFKFLEALLTPENRGIKTQMAKVQLLKIEVRHKQNSWLSLKIRRKWLLQLLLLLLLLLARLPERWRP